MKVNRLFDITTVIVALCATMIFNTGCGGGGAIAPHATATAPMSLVVTHLIGWDVVVASSIEIDKVKLFFANGNTETSNASGFSATVHSNSNSTLNYIAVKEKGGDYWYFDNSGLWLPGGYVPFIHVIASVGDREASNITVGSTTLAIDASDTYCEIKVGYADGTVQTIHTVEMNGNHDLVIAGEFVQAVRITLLSDGSKWYMDAAGNPLPMESKWYQDLD